MKALLAIDTAGMLGDDLFDQVSTREALDLRDRAFMVELVKQLAKVDEKYRANKAKWTVDSPEVKAVAKWTKADAKDVPATMALYTFPTMAEQAGPNWLGGAAVKAMTSTAVFLKEQGRIQEMKPDYKAFVTDVYVKKAMAAK